ncbi:unnamed protein product [Citrullus colocynthis]|uniref:RING-CH-type domain-containing protein n=1 Tax=Citrullus colocynthis TaxID=252529 RepID=A0ABP0YP35_9ROSI
MGEVFVYVDEFQFQTSYDVSRCRICHEEEFESPLQLEAPCSCSGTIKFAHRDCIQRWCSEKGSTVCEICLQNYEPGYTAPSKKPQHADPGVAIGDSVEIPRSEDEEGAEPASPPGDGGASDSACSTTADRGASCCKSVALTFTLVLLVRHFYDVVAVGTAEYPFTLATKKKKITTAAEFHRFAQLQKENHANFFHLLDPILMARLHLVNCNQASNKDLVDSK